MQRATTAATIGIFFTLFSILIQALAFLTVKELNRTCYACSFQEPTHTKQRSDNQYTNVPQQQYTPRLNIM
ncbi:hypothetical protein Bpfe_028628 [Biomphalaria pfeifferi]|uniref:Secreted protein n=1 Tax=Biomphalaria pfeifferi TaxID=112525 RepID=A0AAD8AT19_BIOPF|nr:hypothetical protein Bpfe_028628 [Biomphalaria pfeifferi]